MVMNDGIYVIRQSKHVKTPRTPTFLVEAPKRVYDPVLFVVPRLGRAKLPRYAHVCVYE